MAFKDTFGVEYSDDRQTLLKCPTSLSGSYTVSPMVTIIGEAAFKGCEKITHIDLPEGTERIEYGAFEGCKGLKTILIPINVRRIDRKAFFDCINIEEVIIESLDVEIDKLAFVGCEKIKTACIANVTGAIGLKKAENVRIIKSARITNEMLSGFRSMKKLYVPSSVSLIEEGALISCSSLCEVIVDSTNQHYSVFEGALYNNDKTELLFLPRNWIGDFYIPNTVKKIMEGAIKDCPSLTRIIITENVEIIGKKVHQFDNCPSLSSIVVENNPNYYSIEGALYDSNGNLLRCPENKNGKFILPYSAKGIANGSFTSCNNLIAIQISSGVEKIGINAFGDYKGVIEVVPDNIHFVCLNGLLIDKTDSSIIFAEKNITGEVVIEEGILTIGQEAFSGCDKLKSISLPISLKTIRMGAFLNCSNLSQIDFKDGIESIGEGAFLGCKKLTCVLVPNSVIELQSAFDDQYTTKISIPKGLQSVISISPLWRDLKCSFISIVLNSGTDIIRKELLKGCSAVVDITIPASVKSIEANAFDDCKALKAIYYDGTIEDWLSIDNKCFVKNGFDLYIKGHLLTDIVISGDKNEIKSNAFYYCQSLKHVEIREGVRFIGPSAFNKTGISGEIILPDSIESIGDYAFLSCKSLRSISIPQKANLKNGVFRYCDNLESIVVRGADMSSETFALDGVLFENHELFLLMGGDDGKNHEERYNQLILTHYPCGRKASKYIIPKGVESIGDYAFTGVQNLTLVFHEFVSIDKNTFLNAKVKIQVPVGLKQKFINGKYPKDAIEEVWMPETIAEDEFQRKCLNVVSNNPFRVLGLCTNATAKEVSANKTKITRFADVGKNVDFPLDLNGLIGQCIRDKATIEKASASLSLPQDKIRHALFWFAKESTIDEMALEHVQAGNIEKAIELLEKRENWSALMNLGVLFFVTGKVVNAVGSIMKAIHNDSYRNALLHATCGEAFAMNKTDLSHLFINMLKEEMPDKALLSMMFENGFTEETDYLKDEIIDSILSKINSEIDKTSQTNPDDAEASYQAGVALMDNTKQLLADLKRFLGTSDLQYQSTANNVAKRILQFGINYHNAAGASVEYEKALSLAKYAESIAEGKIVKERCAENLKVMGENNIHAKTKEDEKQVIDKLNACKDVKPSLKTALKLVDDCTPSLMSIKKIMGQTAPYYLKLSSSVANCALGMVITVVNDSQKNDNDRKKLKVVEEAEKVMDAIGKLDMSLDGKQHFNQNKNTLDSIKTTLQIYKRTVWNELTGSSVFWFFVFLIGIGVVGGIIDLIAEGEFWPGFGIGCGLGLISIFNGKYGTKRRR